MFAGCPSRLADLRMKIVSKLRINSTPRVSPHPQMKHQRCHCAGLRQPRAVHILSLFQCLRQQLSVGTRRRPARINAAAFRRTAPPQPSQPINSAATKGNINTKNATGSSLKNQHPSQKRVIWGPWSNLQPSEKKGQHFTSQKQ